MKRAIFLYLLMFIFLAASSMAFNQPDAKKVCPFTITGLWRSDATTESTPLLFNFSPEGYVTLLSYSPDTPVQDFEVINSVNYKLDKPAAPKQIEFTTPRGNDIFQRGVTSFKIIEYSDNNFTTLDSASEQLTRWERMPTHLYFLTFAAHSGLASPGGSALVMWTVMDGRKTDVETLGVQLTSDDNGKTLPVFGPIEAGLYNQLTAENDKDKKDKKDENVFIRVELTPAEFEITHNIYQTWDKYVKTQALPNSDPYLNGLEFIKKVAESINQCGEKARLQSLTQRERDEIVSKFNSSSRPLEYIKVMRKKNDDLHVNNKVYPWSWRPVLQLQGQ
ncbi:MAG: hypothetical protein WBV94_12125 [Blastocatellia bacterium]